MQKKITGNGPSRFFTPCSCALPCKRDVSSAVSQAYGDSTRLTWSLKDRLGGTKRQPQYIKDKGQWETWKYVGNRIHNILERLFSASFSGYPALEAPHSLARMRFSGIVENTKWIWPTKYYETGDLLKVTLRDDSTCSINMFPRSHL